MSKKPLKKQRRLGFLAGGMLGLFSKSFRQTKLSPNEFRVSTKRIGVRFNANIRRFWRKKWVSVNR